MPLVQQGLLPMEPVSNPPNTAPRLKLVAQAELLAKLPAIDPPPVDCILSPAGRTGTVTFKPYDDVRPPKKRFAFHGSKADGGSRAVNVEDLYPEILCLIFSKLDVRSKGRAAQVNYMYYNENKEKLSIGARLLTVN